MKKEEFFTQGPHQTEGLGARLAQELSSWDVVGLVGELGSGKTTFVKGMARGLGIKGYVKSPSFTIVHVYEGGRLPLYHIDLYRVGSTEEAADAGLEEYIYAQGISVIEWADRVPDILRACTYVVRFFHQGDGRRIVIERAPEGSGP